MKTPDPARHLYVSLWKSCIRIVACVALAVGSLGGAALLFFIAEVLGVGEELV